MSLEALPSQVPSFQVLDSKAPYLEGYFHSGAVFQDTVQDSLYGAVVIGMEAITRIGQVMEEGKHASFM